MYAKLLMIIYFLVVLQIVLNTSINAQDNRLTSVHPVGREAFEIIRQFYDYDKSKPLEVMILDKIEKLEYIKKKIGFSSKCSKVVTSYLAIPKIKQAPYPCVLLLHGINSSKESWWEENNSMGSLTHNLLSNGFAILSLDAEYHGERAANNKLSSPTELLKKGWFVSSRDMVIQTVIDYRRALDYLTTVEDIDISRIGILGYSMGGIMTFIMSAIEPRIKVSVSCVSPIVSVPYLPTAVHNFAPYIKQIPFLMLMANKDEQNYSVEEAKLLHQLIGSNKKELIFYESGHMLPNEWTAEAADWIMKYLK